MTDQEPIYFRVSETLKAQRCLRTWWLGYRAGPDGTGLQPRKRDTGDKRDVGTLFHAGVAAYYRGHNPGQLMRETWMAMVASDPEGVTEQATKAYELAAIMLDGWVQWLAAEGHDVDEETLLVEERIEMPLGTFRGREVILYGTPDRVVRQTSTGLLILEDTKTGQSLERSVRLQVDPQLLTYAGMLRAVKGLEVDEMRHQVAKKSKRTARATPPFYARVSVPVTEELLDARWKHLASTVDLMVERIQRMEAGEDHHVVVPPTVTGACDWDCDFLAVCPLMDEGAYWEAALEGMYEPRPAYPEAS